MNKTIQINPELFSISKQKKQRTLKNEIKIKPAKETNRNNNTLSNKNKLLKYIRRHQEENAKKDILPIEPIQNKYLESVAYLDDIADKLKKEDDKPIYPANKNYTLKNHQNENVSMVFPESLQPMIPIPLPIYHSDLQKAVISAPKYGCLKHGTLPTYRQFHGQQTQKVQYPYINTDEITLGVPEKVGRKKTNLNYKSQKKILTRTFRIGKSEKKRKISVLVSNKTIRNNYFSNNKILKETPIIDVRRYLVKHGLIKIGSIAPNDVLRQMFESASIICGDVTNHNNETLMYNYLNSDKKIW